MPNKRSKKHPLNTDDKRHNRAISRDRILAENVMGAVKRFKIVADKYRNRRRRFGLRVTLIAAAYNKDVTP